MNPARPLRRSARLAALLGLCAAACAQAPSPQITPPAPTPDAPAPAAAGSPTLAVDASTPRPNPTRAAEAFLSGRRRVEHHDLAGAQAEFTRAAALDPARHDYTLALTLTREQRISDLIQQAAKARLADHPAQADTLLASARAIDPTDEFVLEHTAALPAQVPLRPEIVPSPAIQLAGPTQLQPSLATQDLHLRGDARQAITQAASLFGIKAIFDDSVTPTPIHVDLEHTTYATAMPLLLQVTHLFAVPLDTRLILVARDTQENRTRFEHQLEETIYLPGSTPEQLNEVTNVVKSVFDIQKAFISANRGTLTLRAPEATLKAVNLTLDDLLQGPPDVQLEIKLVSFNRTNTLNTGASTPTSIGAFSVAAEAQSLVSANQSILATAISSGALTLPSTNTTAQNLLLEAVFLIASGAATDAKLAGLIGTIGGGLTLLGVNIGGSSGFNLALNSSDARALDDITVRVGDGETSTLRVGEKYPVTVSQYSSGISSSTASALAGATINGVSVSSLLNSVTSATVPQIQYEDLGITLKTKPVVLRSGMVSVQIDFKIEALTGAALDNIPILTSRNFVSSITVADGSTALMLSDLSRTEQRAVSGIPFLGELPGLSDTVANTMRETDGSELVLMVTPHLVRRRKDFLVGPRIPFHSTVPADY